MKGYRVDGDDRVVFSADMTLTELIDANNSLLLLFMRLGVQLPFGDVTVEQMCLKNGFSQEMFLMMCRVYSAVDYTPEIECVNPCDLKLLLRYLKASHHSYRKVQIPRIGRGVDRLLEKCDEKQRMVLHKFYESYANEVYAHLDHEEQVVFPYVESLAESGLEKPQIVDLAEHHSDICDKVDDIKSILIKYLPESCTTEERSEVLFDIFDLREDLAKHTRLEMRILEPALAEIERRAKL